ncbi:MAG: hypothetical protein ACLRMJ_06875 [Alistipes finegoldii]
MECNVQPADIEVKFSGPITGWVDGDDLLPDGEGEVETPTVEWGGVKYEIVTLKDGRTWMAETCATCPKAKPYRATRRTAAAYGIQAIYRKRPIRRSSKATVCCTAIR